MAYKLAVEGAAIKALPHEEHWFEIIAPAPRYEQVPDLSDPDKKKEKLIMNVKIKGNMTAEYYPNLTSARFMANRNGTGLEIDDLKKWIGSKFMWGSIVKQNVGGNMKDVLYVTHKISGAKEAADLAKSLTEVA